MSGPRLLLFLVFPLALLSAPGAVAAERKFQPVGRDMTNRPESPGDTGWLELHGNASYNQARVREALATSLREIEEGGLTRPRADDAAYFLSVFYRKEGYALAEVRWEIRGKRLVLNIKEGPRTYLRQITFQGNQSQTSAALYEYMIGETGERLKGTPGQFPFVEADMQTGVARVRGLYESEGRLDAVVSDAEFTYSKDKTSVDVLVKIVEGPKYVFGELTFAGKPIFERSRLIEALGNPSGEPPNEAADAPPRANPLTDPFTQQRANTMQHNLLYFFKLQGYYAAKVEVVADQKKALIGHGGVRRVPVVFTAQPGPLYHFDGVKVTGLERLHPDFMTKRFGGLHGEVYNPTTLDERFREVLRTGLFKNLRLKTTPLPNDEVLIDLTAEEAKAKEVGFSIGFSSYEGAIAGLRVGDRNFMGNGRPLSLSLDYSTRAVKAEILYVDPWWYDSDNALRARIFVQSREEEGYTKTETGLRADVTRKVTKRIELGTFVEVKAVSITDSLVEPRFLGPTSYEIATLGLTQSYDHRDNPINPSKGWIASTGFDVDAVAGEVAFGRAVARLSLYQPIFKRYLLAAGVRGGFILPFTEVPISERFFNGGSTSVRSFRERRLGPKDKHGFPVGGEAFSTFNLELIIPVHDALAAALFIDAGNVDAEEKAQGYNDLRFAIGLGIRYRLPIGPLRLDVGVNPDQRIGEPWGAVHFTFGFAF